MFFGSSWGPLVAMVGLPSPRRSQHARRELCAPSWAHFLTVFEMEGSKIGFTSLQCGSRSHSCLSRTSQLAKSSSRALCAVSRPISIRQNLGGILAAFWRNFGGNLAEFWRKSGGIACSMNVFGGILAESGRNLVES